MSRTQHESRYGEGVGLVFRHFLLGLATIIVAGFSSAAQSPWVWAPYLGAVGEDYLALSWETSRKVSVDLHYSLFSTYSDSQRWEETLTFDRQEGPGEIWLRDLLPGREYAYQMVSYDGDAVYPSRVGRFQTLSDTARSFSILMYGETQALPDRHRLVAEAMAREEEDACFVVHVGHLTSDPSLERYMNLMWAIGDLAHSTPYLPLADGLQTEDGLFFKTFALPAGGGVADEEWWSIDQGPLHVATVNTALLQQGGPARDAQLAWLRSDLTKASGKIIVVAANEPIYSASARPESSRALQDLLCPLLQEHDVKIVISGGVGCYEHIYREGTHYITTGGGGGPLVEPPSELAPGTVFRRYGLLHYLRLTVADRALRLEVVPVAVVQGNDAYLVPIGDPIDAFVLRDDS